jgi:H/ACA ribonucleoprotein complex subunit 4
MEDEKKKSKKDRKSSSKHDATDADVKGPSASSSSGGANVDFMIEPSSETARLDTSKWPLLLKHYNQLHIRTAHYTVTLSIYPYIESLE